MYCTGRRESSQKQPHRESGRRAQLFPQLVWVYTVDSACPLASALTPCTFRCNGAQSKSLTRAHGDGGGMGGGTGAGYPLSSFTVSLFSGQGHRGQGWHRERKGNLTSILFLQMGAFKLHIFQAKLIYPGNPWGVQQGSQGGRKP